VIFARSPAIIASFEASEVRSYDMASATNSRSDVDLSSYRLLVRKQWHVAVLGELPPEAVDKRVRQILASGEAVSLPEDILRVLNHRRLLAKQVAPWVEAHHTPGMVVDLGDPDKQQE
jgi:hypothetical protein